MKGRHAGGGSENGVCVYEGGWVLKEKRRKENSFVTVAFTILKSSELFTNRCQSYYPFLFIPGVGFLDFNTVITDGTCASHESVFFSSAKRGKFYVQTSRRSPGMI